MPGYSDYLEGKHLDWLFKRTQLPTPPNTLYFSLHFNDPEGDGNSELHLTSGNAGYSPGYARVAYNTDTNNSTNAQFTAKATAGSGQQCQNVGAIAWLTATGNWNQPIGGGTAQVIPFVGMWDASSGGNFLGSMPLVAPGGGSVTVTNGQVFSLPGSNFTGKVD